MGYITQTKDYWIAPNAVNITLNALGEANRIQGSVASGAVIMCWVDGIAELGYDNGHEYRRWPLSLSPTYFNTPTAKYVYAAVPRSTSIGSQAVIVFPSEQLDINGKNASEQQIGSTDYLYIYLHGIISEVLTENNSTFRRWTLDPNENWGQLDTAAARDAQKNTSDWYHYDQSTQLVSLLKGIVMSATSWFQNLRLGNKELTGVATATTGDEYIDSDELVATPSYINAKYLSKTHEDTAEAKITFQDGLEAKSVRVTGSNSTTPDTDNQAMKEVGLDVVYSGVIGGVLRVAKSVLTKTIQSLNFSGSDSLTGTGWQLTDDDGNGRSRLIVDDAVFRGKVSLNQLEVRKLTAMGGNYVFSPAAGIIEEVDYYGYKIVPGEVEPAVELLGYEYIKVPWVLRLIPLSLRGRYLSRKKWVRSTMTAEDYDRVKFYRCWLKADDGSTQTINTWQVGMLARCQTFDTSQIENGTHAGSYDKPQDSGGTYSNVTNKLYWRAVVATGQGVDKNNYAGQTVVLDDGRKHNYIDLANYMVKVDNNDVQLFLTGSDHVSAGDHIVCFGDWKDRQLANLVTIETVGSDAPAVKEFVGVGYTDGTPIDWSLDGKVLTRISPISGNKFVAPEFIIETTGEKLGMKPRSSANVLGFYPEQDPVANPQNGDTLLLHYTDYASENVYREYDATEGAWKAGKFVLGTTVVNQHDGHIYEVTSTGWRDLGLMDESKSQLHAELKVTADRIEMKVREELGETGIDIDKKQIRLIGDQVGFYNKTTNTEYIKIGLEDALYNGQTVKMPYFIFLAPDGVTEMYNLGYTGLRQLVNNAVPDKWTAVVLMGAVLDYGKPTAQVTALQHDTDVKYGDLINPMLIKKPELSSHIGEKGWFDNSEDVTPMGEKGVWVFEEGYTVNAQGQRIYNIGGNTPSQYDGCYYCDQETSQQGIPLHPVNADTADYGWYFVGGEKIVYVENGVVKATGTVTSEADGYVVRTIDPATGRETIILKNWYRLTMKVNGQTVKGVVNDKGGTDFSGYDQSMIPVDDFQHIGQVTIPDFPEEES